MSRIEVTDELIKAAQAGNSDAMWEIVSAFDPMLTSMIRTAAPGASADDAEDLLQEARAVLIQRIRDYSSSASSASLSSFVYRAARRAVTEAHIGMTTALTVDPTTVIRVRRALWEAEGDVERAWEAVSSAVDPKNRIERERFMATLDALGTVERLDAPVTGEDGEGLTLSDVISDPSAEVTNSTERCDLARWLMTQIPQRQSLALRAFYGVGMTRMTDPEVCTDMAVNGVALRRLRSRGIVSARTVATAHDLAA
ncbi:sigma factor [Streptomyces scabiei]|uniref:sigma factor n=1 Tax=Streptomyces scabiei TaxID=1930 RepID=UPI0029A5A984|nr:sigma factor [Streptomyces scabiei]MDX2575943.1 sigma factor [Streptomyces scabiei]MDX2885584.1 sigma factor [Streptomyces scabiei]MDX2993463.1 sigma factor [Streptomyces scabiei]MDX3028423.1 sigma factor [Streptomyces scabiei]MDX3047243.1 sigma factor [Streptomyces scabiei]